MKGFVLMKGAAPKVCSLCDMPVDLDECFCEGCGAELVWWGCRDCGYIPPNQAALYCRYCGKKLTHVVQKISKDNKRVLWPASSEEA